MSDNHLLRGLNGLEGERCAALHNYIVELGWTQRGFALSTLDKRTWWECYGGDAALANVSDRLDASIIFFLKATWHGYSIKPVTGPRLFHRYLACLCSPEQLWQNANCADDQDDSNQQRFVTLYLANWALGADHPLELVSD